MALNLLSPSASSSHIHVFAGMEVRGSQQRKNSVHKIQRAFSEWICHCAHKVIVKQEIDCRHRKTAGTEISELEADHCQTLLNYLDLPQPVGGYSLNEKY